MSKKRTQYSPEFRAKVALAAIRNEKTAAELSSKFGIHPTMISNWKRTLLDSAADIFDKGQKAQKQNEEQIEELYRHIGQLKVECDFLSKKLSL